MKKYLIFTTIIILIIIAFFFSINFFKPKPSTENIISVNQSIPEESNLIIDTLSENFIIEEDEKIYGYDKNAMQVLESYNGFSTCAYIEIPKTKVSLPVLSKQTVSGMEYSCCLLYSTGEINQSGNTFIVAHNYNNGKLFSNNKFLQIGDKIILTGLYKNRLEYTIYNIFNTTPTDTSYLTKKIDKNNIEITLQTCNNDKEDTRLIIEAKHIIKK